MMKVPLNNLIIILIISMIPVLLPAQSGYTDYKSMFQKINSLEKEYPSLCSVRSLVKTAGGKDIMAITIGNGDRDNKPGIAVLGGIEGNHLIGRELALGFASELLKNSGSADIKQLLEKVTFYVFPEMSPDASEQFFSGVKYERTVNGRSTDDDRDFLTGEDPYEDLNNDGLITLMRISDPTGKYIENEDDKRIMSAADLSKGLKGAFSVYPEGIDNDKDGKFNEDGEGGVNFNSNLTFNYEEFGLNAGLHPVSEPETKALLDFLFSHFNIYATIAFGPQDNLGQPMKSPEKPSDERKVISILKSDETINKLVSDVYHELTGMKGAPVSNNNPGNFMEWSYFHYGRYSFSTPGWWIPSEKDKNNEVLFLRFAEENNITDAFVPWTEVLHPDFPDKKVEVGGIRPFVMNNPPADKLSDLVAKNYLFIIRMAEMHPELEITDVKIENAGENVFRLTLKVLNKGTFATCTQLGDRNMWTRIMRLSLETESGQNILSGRKVQRIQRLEGGQADEFSWLVMGKGTIKLTAGAINTGLITTSIRLN